MLQIGINEGFKLGPECKITEKGGIEIHFIQGEVVSSALELLETEDPEAETGKILLFPPQLTTYQDKTARTGLDIIRDIKVDFKRMHTIFNLYFTKEELQKIFPLKGILEGLNITPENEKVMLIQESVVNKIYANLGEMILKVVNTNKLWEKEAFRIKLLRQSPTKAFPTLTRKPEMGDWVELMLIPKEQSKVKFTPYEISKGYNDPTIPTDVVEVDGISNGFEEGGEVINEALPPSVSFD